MHIPQLILTPFALLFIIIGILQQNKKFNEKNIKWANSLRGTKTEITKSTLAAQHVTGWIMIILGIATLLFVFVFIPSLDPALFE
jgi:hypothetical protein